jgi:hypothetical protein
VLKKLLASIALTSVVAALVLLVYWWRGVHGYVDNFTLGRGTATESHFTSERNMFSGQGQILLEVTNNKGGEIVTTIKSYLYRQILGYFLIVPGLWMAIKIRSWLPRPPGMQRPMKELKSRRS